MFEQGQLRRAFLHEAVQGKKLWSVWSAIRGKELGQERIGHVAVKFIAYMDAAVRRDMERYAGEVRSYPTDSLCMIKKGQFTAEELQVFEKVCDWFYQTEPVVFMDALSTIKHNMMAQLKAHSLDNAHEQQMTALINNKLLRLMRNGSFGPFESAAYARAFIAFRRDSNLESGSPFDVPEDMPDIEFMERAVKFLPNIPTLTMRARLAAHIMDGWIDWCGGETHTDIKSRADKVFDEAREYFEGAVSEDSHPRWMAELLLELDETLVNTGELDGEIYEALNVAAATVKEKLDAQARRSFMTPADFMTRDLK